jgi:hypothetical protein
MCLSGMGTGRELNFGKEISSVLSTQKNCPDCAVITGRAVLA